MTLTEYLDTFTLTPHEWEAVAVFVVIGIVLFILK